MILWREWSEKIEARKELIFYYVPRSIKATYAAEKVNEADSN
jgi:hypothetical protein